MFVLAIQASHTAPSRLIFAGFFHSRVVRNYGSFRFQPIHCKSAAGRLPFFTLRHSNNRQKIGKQKVLCSTIPKLMQVFDGGKLL
jgi:hypothetical protein